MISSEITAIFGSNIQAVWNTVTNHQNFQWRSDIRQIEVSKDGQTFTETSKEGIRTTFTITKKVPFAEYAFHMNNKTFTGHFTGLFKETDDGGTKIQFTENIKLKNPFLRLFSAPIARYLVKGQEAYVTDLKRELHEWINNL